MGAIALSMFLGTINYLRIFKIYIQSVSIVQNIGCIMRGGILYAIYSHSLLTVKIHFALLEKGLLKCPPPEWLLAHCSGQNV